jgi:hypothetical protein
MDPRLRWNLGVNLARIRALQFFIELTFEAKKILKISTDEIPKKNFSDSLESTLSSNVCIGAGITSTILGKIKFHT